MELAASITAVYQQIISDSNVAPNQSVLERLRLGDYGPRLSTQNTDTQRRMSTLGCGCREGSSHSHCRPCAVNIGQQPLYDVFLGGSCGNTVWRRQLVIPFLKKKAISYYDPQRSVWSENMIYEESIAKENSSLFLFVLDPATVNATSFLEIAYFAARKAPKLVVVFLGRSEWREKAHREDLPDRLRTCQLLDRILAAHQVPLLHSIEEALTYIEDEIIGGKKWQEALAHPRQRLTYLSLRAKRAARATTNSAREAWSKVRQTASKLAAAGVADAVVLVAGHLVAPAIPLYLIIVPLIVLNILLIAAHTLYRRARTRWPRVVSDSSRVMVQGRSASIPVPRMSTVSTPLIPRMSKGKVKQSKKWCESLVLQQVNGQIPREEPPAWRRVQEISGFRQSSPTDLGTHVFLGCSSIDELTWVTQCAAPILQRNEVAYSTVLASDTVPPESRMALLKRGSRGFRQVLYHIPTTKTFLSGMVEIAYLLGHADWNVTLCVSKEAEQLEAVTIDEDETERAARRRRNDCYAIAYCYLKDMAKRRQCRVFTELDEALGHVVKLARSGGC